MLERINLFPQVEALWARRAKMRRFAHVGSILALILYFIFLSSVLSYSLLLAREADSLEKKIAAYEKKIKRLEAIEAKQVFLKSKLQNLIKVLNVESEAQEILGSFKFFDIEGVNFDTIEFQDGQVMVEGEASDAVVLDQFIKNFEKKGISYYSQAEVTNITRDLDGRYHFELTLLR